MRLFRRLCTSLVRKEMWVNKLLVKICTHIVRHPAIKKSVGNGHALLVY